VYELTSIKYVNGKKLILRKALIYKHIYKHTFRLAKMLPYIKAWCTILCVRMLHVWSMRVRRDGLMRLNHKYA